MATIAIGDIHGNLTALNDLLGQIREEATCDDTVVFLGDYIDRGPNSKGCIEAVLTFQRDIEADVVCLLGNHEDWFLRTARDYHRHSWLLGMEASDTIQSYSPDAARTLLQAASSAGAQLYLGRVRLPYETFFNRVPPEHMRFFESLCAYHESPECLCTHGGLDPRVARIQEQSHQALIWGVNSFPDSYQGAEVVVYGHWDNATLNKNGWPTPKILGRTIGIDTISHGVLTAVRLPDLRIFQSTRQDVVKSDA